MNGEKLGAQLPVETYAPPDWYVISDPKELWQKMHPGDPNWPITWPDYRKKMKGKHLADSVKS